MTNETRRGWRETIEPGLYRAHRLACPSSRDRKPNRRCACPVQILVPAAAVGKTRMVTIAGTIPEARAQRRRLLAEGRPTTPEPTVPVGTLDEFVVAYFRTKAPRLAANTIRNREDDYLNRIGPALGELQLADVNRATVETWLATLIARASSRRMIVQTVATLRVILATALEWGLIPVNPAARLSLPAENVDTPPVERVLTRKQLHALLAAAGSLRTETILRAAGEVGLRRGEIAGLKWGDVDLANRRLAIRRGVVQERSENGHPMRKLEQPTKGRQTRRVAISLALAEQLGQLREESRHSDSDFVWPGRDGGPMHDRSAHRALERASRRARLLDVSGKPLVSLHGLRHTAASIMLSAGVPLIVVSRQLGHATPHITATTYAHLLGDSELDYAAAAFEPKPGGSAA